VSPLRIACSLVILLVCVLGVSGRGRSASSGEEVVHSAAGQRIAHAAAAARNEYLVSAVWPYWSRCRCSFKSSDPSKRVCWNGEINRTAFASILHVDFDFAEVMPARRNAGRYTGVGHLLGCGTRCREVEHDEEHRCNPADSNECRSPAVTASLAHLQPATGQHHGDEQEQQQERAEKEDWREVEGGCSLLTRKRTQDTSAPTARISWHRASFVPAVLNHRASTSLRCTRLSLRASRAGKATTGFTALLKGRQGVL